MAELNLLRSLPPYRRDLGAIERRAAGRTFGAIEKARQYGKDYFDGDRKYGYGGYKYDGRWVPVARDIMEHYNLHQRDRVLDIGCAKGFLVKDLLAEGLDAYGLDISLYALANCEPEVVGRLHFGTAPDLRQFPDKSFDLVLSINTLHNLNQDRCEQAVREIVRVSKGPAFIQVDSYTNPHEKKLFEDWVLTARHHDYPDGWLRLFAENGYQGDYAWTVV